MPCPRSCSLCTNRPSQRSRRSPPPDSDALQSPQSYEDEKTDPFLSALRGVAKHVSLAKHVFLVNSYARDSYRNSSAASARISEVDVVSSVTSLCRDKCEK